MFKGKKSTYTTMMKNTEEIRISQTTKEKLKSQIFALEKIPPVMVKGKKSTYITLWFTLATSTIRAKLKIITKLV